MGKMANKDHLVDAWYAELSRRLLAARVNAGLTQATLAWMINLSQTRLCKIERGIERPTTNNVLRIREATGQEIKLPNYYTTVFHRDDDLWYFVGRDGQVCGPYATQREAEEAEGTQFG